MRANRATFRHSNRYSILVPVSSDDCWREGELVFVSWVFWTLKPFLSTVTKFLDVHRKSIGCSIYESIGTAPRATTVVRLIRQEIAQFYHRTSMLHRLCIRSSDNHVFNKNHCEPVLKCTIREFKKLHNVSQDWFLLSIA